MDRRSPLKIALPTLGCKVNQSDAAALAAELREQGNRIVPLGQGADVCIIHTCTVTEKTDAQSRQLVRRVIRENPQARIIVTGCYAQVDPQALQAISGVGRVVGIGERAKIPGLISGDGEGGGSLGSFSGPDWEEGRLPILPGRTRAFLKIQDGCNASCSYCIVPRARGRSRSLPPESVRAKIRLLARQGCREVVLSGIHLGSYGEDLVPSRSLLDLLEALEAEPEGVRLRLSSIEPGELTPPFIRFLAASKKVCPHLHIPLQSGDDEILRRMNRSYDRIFFEGLIREVHRVLPEAGIGVDVIAGFPGESRQAFAHTIDLIERLPLAYLHVFPFSLRRGTPAADLSGQVPAREIKARCRKLRELGEAKGQAFQASFLGKRVGVLLEGKRRAGLLQGFSRNYIPVLVRGGDELVNRELEVELIKLFQGRAVGRP